MDDGKSDVARQEQQRASVPETVAGRMARFGADGSLGTAASRGQRRGRELQFFQCGCVMLFRFGGTRLFATGVVRVVVLVGGEMLVAG